MTWIQTIEPSDASGDLHDVYRAITTARSGVAEIHKALSLNPKAIRAHLEIYKTIMFARSSLSRIERERIGTVVSAANKCAYCAAHHSEAARQAGDDEDFSAALANGEIPESADAAQRALYTWVRKTTLSPNLCTEGDILRLREHGFDDTQILDASLVVAYFNFVNRLVLTLGVDLEEDFERTCGGD